MPSVRTEIEEITVKLKNGKTIKIDPKEKGAVFWGDTAITHIFAPYYRQYKVNSKPKELSQIFNTQDLDKIDVIEKIPNKETSFRIPEEFIDNLWFLPDGNNNLLPLLTIRANGLPDKG